MCPPLGDPAVQPSGEDVASICSDDIMHELLPDSLEKGSYGIESEENALPGTIRKATPPAQPSEEAPPPAKPAGDEAKPFSPSDVV
eukprot:5538297-Pyramimonas_sp.AAC.1